MKSRAKSIAVAPSHPEDDRAGRCERKCGQDCGESEIGTNFEQQLGGALVGPILIAAGL